MVETKPLHLFWCRKNPMPCSCYFGLWLTSSCSLKLLSRVRFPANFACLGWVVVFFQFLWRNIKFYHPGKYKPSRCAVSSREIPAMMRIPWSGGKRKEQALLSQPALLWPCADCVVAGKSLFLSESLFWPKKWEDTTLLHTGEALKRLPSL